LDICFDVTVQGSKDSLARLAEVLRRLAEGRPGELDEDSELYWQENLPEWLVSNFATKASGAKSRAWMHMWRWSSESKRIKMERESGWELLDWLYWFSSGNEFWSLSEINWGGGESMSLSLSVVDNHIPTRALEWVVEKSGAEIVSIRERDGPC
jgi:hypothetical protein